MPGSGASSVKSGKLAALRKLGSGDGSAASTVSVPKMSTNPTKPVRVSYLTEQTSHHPPVSAFYVDCPEKGIHARGFDQIMAKFTGTSIKVMPGEHNLGIFITVDKRNHETYQLKHPAAHLGGFLRGALNVTVGDMAYVTCPETKLKAILRYYDEGWLGRTTNKVEGIIFRYDPENDDKVQIRDVPEEDILIRLGGPWKEKVVFTVGSKPLVSLAASTILDCRANEDLELPPPLGANHHHRHCPAERGAQGAPAIGEAAPTRIPSALERGYQGHPRKAVFPRDNGQAGA